MKKTSRNKGHKADDGERARHPSARPAQKPADPPRKRKREGCSGGGPGGGPVAVAGIRG